MTHDRCARPLRRTTLSALACAAVALAPMSARAQAPAARRTGVRTASAQTVAAQQAVAPKAVRRSAGGRKSSARRAVTAPVRRVGGDSTAAASGALASTAPAPFVVLTASPMYLRDSIVALARKQLGRRYVLGAESPERGFDCSGLVRYLMAALDVRLPRTAAQQEHVGESVPKRLAELEPGDLVTFGRGKRASHIGIYVGDGRFIHASSLAGKVIESQLVRPGSRRTKAWRTARRLVVTPDSTLLNSLLLNNAALGVRS